LRAWERRSNSLVAELIFDMFTLFGPVPPRGGETGTGRLQALLQRHGVAGAVTLSTRGLYHSAAAGNRETIALCAESGGRLLPAAVLDPRQSRVLETITGVRVLCLLPATQHWPLNYAPLADLLNALGESNAISPTTPIWCEASRTGDATGLAEILKTTKFRAPVILGSVCGDDLLEATSVARDDPNIHIATNYLRGVGEIALAVSSVGPERVVFASEAPTRSLGSAVALVRQAGLAPGEVDMVLGGNARRLLNRGGAAA
jgi:hypothetical protein